VFYEAVYKTLVTSRTTLAPLNNPHNRHHAYHHHQRIRLGRLAQLLGLSPDECEKQLSSLVSDGALFAKVDRPAGIVVFAAKVRTIGGLMV
jgi:hypothetical protein